MIAYHYPPLAGSSGIQRTLRFSQDLPTLGWQPAVLTAHPRAYEKLGSDLLRDIPPGVDVKRAFALDARRHLAVYKRYPGWIARPDRWLSWLPGAVVTGLKMIRQQRPDVIWSTYPIPTAHLIGYWLARFSGVPWVADFRDPMAHQGYPPDQATWNSYLRVEQKVFSQAARMAFTTPGAARLYTQRYPRQADRICVIENGYDDASFEPHGTGGAGRSLNPGKLTLLHSGIVYPEWRNPKELFIAVRQLIDHKLIAPQDLCLRFRAPEHSEFIASLATKYRLNDMVELLPPIGYREALAEMCAADGLLILQSIDCNDQIPAKIYEYIRARRPVLGLCGSTGDTADALQRAGFTHTAPLESSQQIGTTLERFLADVRRGAAPVASDRFVESASRGSKAAQLAALLAGVRAEHSA
ncbi:MAG: glycosyltransferase [Rhodoferax sp.]|nr:glycosyltransferase [Rhodoferax sp.]